MNKPSFGRTFRAWLLLAGSFAVASFATAVPLRVRYNDVPVFAKSQKEGAPLARLKSGDKVEGVAKTNAQFWQVKLSSGVIGYVLAFALAPSSKSTDGQSSIGESVTDLMRKMTQEEKSDAVDATRSRSTDSIMGVRGLSPSAEIALLSEIAPDLRRVRVIERRILGQSPIATRNFAETLWNEIGAKPSFNLPSQTESPLFAEAKPPAPTSSAETELALGRNLAGRFLHYTGSFKNPGTPEYLTTIANYLADQMGSDRRFGVEILNDARTNAFACPGGFLLITKGMLLAAQSEAEIAGVIAHEMAHVERGHMLSLFAQSSSKAIQGSLANRSVPQDEVMQIRRRKSDDSTHDTATDLITNSLLQASGGVLRTGVTMGLDALIGKGLSPEDEFEADALALEILTASGFDPIAYINFLERQFAANKRVASPIARTHPATIERVAKLRAQWVSLGSPTGATMKQRFKNQTQTRKVESQQ